MWAVVPERILEGGRGVFKGGDGCKFAGRVEKEGKFRVRVQVITTVAQCALTVRAVTEGAIVG